MQEKITINNVALPIIKEGGEVYYPISFIGNKVLLKDLSGNQLVKNGYGKYIKQFEIDFGEKSGGIQLTYCISEEGLRIVLNNSKIGRLSLEQKKAMNKVLEYLGMEVILEDERFIKTIDKQSILNYSEYIQDCIDETLQKNPDILWQKCSKCNNYYPYHINFFRKNPHSGYDFPLYTFCRDCCGWSEDRGKDWIRSNDKELSKVYRQYGLNMYISYKNNDIIGAYENWLCGTHSVSHMPKILNNKENHLLVIKYLVDSNKISIDNLNMKNLKNQFKLSSIEYYTNINEIYKYLFKDRHLNYPWEYPNFELPKDTSFEQYNKIFNNYLEVNNIKINNIYEFDYVDICKRSKIYSRVMYNILEFVMKYYDEKYPAYKFKIQAVNYWKNRDNRIKALKYLIEEDMKIEIEKIPLYLTLTSIRNIGTTTMYNLLKKFYKKGLWEWVNEIYPDKFTEEDFNISVVRNMFDSAEEHIIHDILISKFENVIYNQRNTKITIKIKGMNPDWLIITDNGVWIIEYFGIDVKQKNYNKRITTYKKKALSKIDRYEELKWLGKVYVYPDDLKNNFEGLKDKLKAIV